MATYTKAFEEITECSAVKNTIVTKRKYNKSWEERSIVRIFANITKHKKPDIQEIITVSCTQLQSVIVMVIKGMLSVKYFYNGMAV